MKWLSAQGSRFAVEIALVLLLKGIALALIWVFLVRGHETTVDDRSMEAALSFNHAPSHVHGGQHHD